MQWREQYKTGMRVSEGATTRGCDLLADGNFVVIQERGGFVPKTPDSARRVPVTEAQMADLRLLVTSPEAPLIPSNGKGLYHYWRHRPQQAQKEAGVPEFTFHPLRRAVSDHLRSGGVPLDRYARFMGHAPVTAVRHYSTVAPDDLHTDLQAGLTAARTRPAK
ncbi:MAG: hypothetical protein AMXMBFR64_51620 [Myxococcales bacterium]